MREVACADGGAMLEVYRAEGWGQVNVRVIPPGATAGGHRHPRTKEWWMLLRGALRVRHEDERGATRETVMAPGGQLVVLAGRGHAVESVGEEEAVLLYRMDRLYDPEDPDKEPWTPSA